MKIYFKSLLFAASIAALLTYSGCKPDKDPEPSVEEVQLGKLKGTWKITTGSDTDVTLANPGVVSKKSDYPNFQITIDGTFTDANSVFNYTVSGRPVTSPWPASGTWKFDSTNPENIAVRLDDNISISYSVDNTHLQLVFQFTGSGYSRTSSVEGQWTFTLSK